MRYSYDHKAFVSYDAMLSMMPVMFLLAFIFQIISFLHDDAAYAVRQKELFNFLVVAADYVVKKGAVEDNQGHLQPNLIDQDSIDSIESAINENSKYKITITLSDSDPPPMQTCIYRLVVEESLLQIKKLYVCGSYANH